MASDTGRSPRARSSTSAVELVDGKTQTINGSDNPMRFGVDGILRSK